MTEPEITPDLVAAHGLTPDEYARVLSIIGRVPTFTELGIVSAMWNEHCSYKSSKKWLRTLHTTQDRTGVLIFAALSDHQVEIVADEGIYRD